jgi:hypothetical protein
MKKLENYGLVELNATEIMNIAGGYGWGPIFTCIYSIPVPRPNSNNLGFRQPTLNSPVFKGF